MTRKLVIEISDDEGKTALLKRRNGLSNFIDNIDSFFKNGGKGRRAIKGVKMFFVDETAAALVLPGAGPVIPAVIAGGTLMTEDELRDIAEAGAAADE